MQSQRVIILGAGLAGLSAGHRLNRRGFAPLLLEKNAYVGGHAASHVYDGFVFDEGPHVSFTKNQIIQRLLSQTVKGCYREQKAEILNYWKRHWITHPAQCHLYGLPAETVEKCILGFIEAHQRKIKVRSYADWCLNQFGRYFCEEFTFRYTQKYWAVEPTQMTFDWVGPRVYRPSLNEVLRGALSENSSREHYILKFRYPDKGGFGAYAQGMRTGLRIDFGSEMTAIDLKRKEIIINHKTKHVFDVLISSLPLPELVRRIKGVPSCVSRAAEQLICTSLVLINLGINRCLEFPGAHWLYFYDDDIVFSRAHFPHRLALKNAPNNCGSLQLEVYHSKYRGLPCKDILGKAIRDAYKIGLLRRGDKILTAKEQRIPYANILFDFKRASALKEVQKYLKQCEIISCGRYGEWDYFWSDDSILSGWRAAEKVINRRR